MLICDLPCSGLGIIGRKPDIKYNVTYEKIKELALLQRKILSTVWEYVKKTEYLYIVHVRLLLRKMQKILNGL